jgi:hypothetical protein
MPGTLVSPASIDIAYRTDRTIVHSTIACNLRSDGTWGILVDFGELVNYTMFLPIRSGLSDR